MVWPGPWEPARCQHPTSRYRAIDHTLGPDLVTGKPAKFRQRTCAGARIGSTGNECGFAGRYWEAAWRWRRPLIAVLRSVVLPALIVGYIFLLRSFL